MTTKRQSAGLLMYRKNPLRVFLAHPGGPFFARRDDGAWTIPKGEMEPEADALSEAIREFKEETGIEPQPPFTPLGSVRQAGGKEVFAWGFEAPPDLPDCPDIKSNTFAFEWPRGSGRMREVPEMDRGEFFTVPAARQKMNKAQSAFLSRLTEHLEARRTRKSG